MSEQTNSEGAKKPMSGKTRIILIASISVLVILAIVGGTLLWQYFGEGGPGNVSTGGVLTFYSPSAVDVGSDGTVYVSDETAGLVTAFNASGEKTAEYEAGASVQKVMVDGDSVYALVGGLDGRLVVLSLDLKEEVSISVGHTPIDIAVADGIAYVANRFSGTVSVVSLSERRELKTIEAGREPSALLLNGTTLFVANLLPNQSMADENVASAIQVIDVDAEKISRTISLTNGSQTIRGMCLSPDGKTLYVTHILSRYTYSTTQLDRGWINTNAFSVVDVATGENYAILLDSLERGAANPWDVEMSEDGEYLYFAISGTGEIERVKVSSLETAVARVENDFHEYVSSVDKICDYVPFLSNVSETARIDLSLNGLRDLTVSGGKVYATAYYDGKVVCLNEETLSVESELRTAEQPMETAVREGERLWNDATICYQNWESCASCHPDARVDALNWDNLNDGLGNPKNTSSMLFSYRSAPVMYTGIRASGEIAARKGMLFIQFNIMSEEKMESIDAYLRALIPVESPYLEKDGSYSEAALRGEKVFVEAGCVTCHPAPLYTDLKPHESPFVGTDGTWEKREIYTPTLAEVWRTAPYSYTGRYTDVSEIIKAYAPDLSDQDAADLREFVLSIGTVNEKYGVVEIFATDASGETIYDALKADTTLTKVSILCQTKNAPTANVKITVTNGSGEVLHSKEEKLSDLVYQELAEIELNFEMGSLDENAKLEIQITDDDGTALASKYVLSPT